MIEFILNNLKIKTDKAPGSTLLDFIRQEALLKGTKIGCREGDCGACTVLVGSLDSHSLNYHSITSCCSPLINAHGKHIVTIEGLELDDLSPVQKAVVDHAGTQCGFCTPGFVVALSGHLIGNKEETAKDSMSGNICRCTGYKSLEKAGEEVDQLKEMLLHENAISSMIEKGWLPEYFSSIKNRLQQIEPISEDSSNSMLIGGGTDIIVQQAENVRKSNVASVLRTIPDQIELKGDLIQIGAGISMASFFQNEIIKEHFPSFKDFFPLIASSQIRNMGTLAGNIVNASPIGDMSIILLALNANLILSTGRIVAIKDFFLDYKKTDLKEGEYIQYITVDKSLSHFAINFEKVSKRTYLDIASVNSAIGIQLSENRIEKIFFAAGGVAAIPKFLSQTCEFLESKILNIETIHQAIDVLMDEVSPISDIRGGKDYKSLLLRQLFLSHMLKLFPQIFKEDDIIEFMSTKNPAL